ncbi:SDR family oxidoreductase [Nodosilinea sp. LEGE 07088]|uniref:SDR family oxidoreductase n=1 Tax=Nodosilinea sp. LEGE 07088 TaxID=2777968 RepID=UPI0018829F3E|nr:SDR family oxidoreductase [Nodosilinea sp. LEGE 07088]MBE9140193.1 SDR family oxidoreductase [Nodosilinea sp. LEGE 07088]
MQIKGAIALVTGANGDIGQYFVKALCDAGATKVYACARKPSDLTSLVAVNPEQIIPIALDITNSDSVETVAQACQDVNLLINNAGVGLLKGFISAADLSSARAEIEVNYLGTLAMCRAFAPILQANGGGAIVNMLSILGKINFPMNASYSASKAAAVSLTQGLRMELKSQNTLVVGVLPGTVDTPGSQHFPPPKVSPEDVVREALQGVIDGVNEVYPGEQAKQMAAQLLQDPQSLENAMSAMVNR